MRPLQAGSVAAAALVVVSVVSACGSVESTDTAASVGDERITVEEFESLLQTVTEHSDLLGVPEDTATGTVAGEQARTVLARMIEDEVNTQFLAANGESITDEDRQQVLQEVPEDDPVRELPDDVLTFLVDTTQAGAVARSRVPLPDADELQQRYDDDPSSLGVMCVRHVLVGTQDEAIAALDEVAAGTPIEDVAAERSTDQTTADNGGAVEGADGAPCQALPIARQTLDPAFVDAAMTSRPGEAVGPVESSSGWHVIEARPYDEVSDSVASLFEQAGAELLYAAFASGTDIRVDPRYGRWDAGTNAVVAL